MLRVGHLAPVIDTVATDGKRFALHEQPGPCVVIYFFPMAFTPMCSGESRDFGQNYAELQLAGATVVGVSRDDHDTQCRFAKSVASPFAMISDRDGSICRAYDVLWPLLGVARRVTYIVSVAENRPWTVDAVFHHELRVRAHQDDVLRFVDARLRATRSTEVEALRPARARALPARPSTPPPRSRVVGPAPGEVVGGKYRLAQLIGEGGSGMVVRAEHVELGSSVAVKFLHAASAQHPSAVERFLREGRMAARITSEHVVRVLDVGTLPSGVPYLVMELLVGSSLNDLLKRHQRLPVHLAVNYVLQACSAIAEAHELGIVHRDLKPANLFVTSHADGSPFVKVLDFGISKQVHGVQQALTATGEMLGSPLYMSPEQIRDSSSVDARTDIWALGGILYTLVAGYSPFGAATALGTLAKVVGDAMPSLDDGRSSVPPGLSAVIARCLEKRAEDWFQRVADLVQALQPFRVAVSSPTLASPGSFAHAPTVLVAPQATSGLASLKATILIPSTPKVPDDLSPENAPDGTFHRRPRP